MLSGLVVAEAFVPLVIDISHDAYYIVLTIPLLTPASEVAEKSLNAVRVLWILPGSVSPASQRSLSGILKITNHLTRSARQVM